MTPFVRRVGAALGLSGSLALAPVAAQPAGAAAEAGSAYPTQPVSLIVPFSPGGDADVAARALVLGTQRALGQPLLPINRAGASGAIGSLAVKQARPDGYTLLLARVGSQVVLPALQPTLAYKWNDFTLLGLLELNPVVCVTRAESPLRTLKDLTDALKARPGKLNYSTSGAGTILNFGPQLLFDQLKLGKDAAVQIAYKGGGEAAMAVIAGDVDFSCGNLTSVIGNIKGGRLRALVTTTPERLKDLPEVPTARESGYPQLEAIVGWSALYGPPGMPRALVDRWTALLAGAAADPQWQAATEKAGSIPRVLGPAETEAFIAAQFAVYERLGRQLQIEIK
ncbi:tripartite tricarboxylate transporter substrate binding protein [Piscinibacter sakaiensis]|uniref:Putative exported protein n=1 Tax=Piscinibacter sakaiensis TaxID=1547922 RepID=A0A0K8P4N1_PISS1|nr:tripartite tricarboxylate transporter substrate binding protein [Piscinibacter sakaiensis]GAP37484.1 putative exported protein [Piscinibacter sakaiensis]